MSCWLQGFPRSNTSMHSSGSICSTTYLHEAFTKALVGNTNKFIITVALCHNCKNGVTLLTTPTYNYRIIVWICGEEVLKIVIGINNNSSKNVVHNVLEHVD